MVQHDGVVLALHVCYGCGHMVSIGWVGTGAASVVAVKAKFMHPTIAYVGSIIGNDWMGRCQGWGHSRLYAWQWCLCWDVVSNHTA